MQITSSYQTVGKKTVQDLKDFNSRSLATQAKKGEQLVSMMPAIKKVLNNWWWYSRIINRKRRFEEK